MPGQGCHQACARWAEHYSREHPSPSLGEERVPWSCAMRQSCARQGLIILVHWTQTIPLDFLLAKPYPNHIQFDLKKLRCIYDPWYQLWGRNLIPKREHQLSAKRKNGYRQVRVGPYSPGMEPSSQLQDLWASYLTPLCSTFSNINTGSCWD